MNYRVRFNCQKDFQKHQKCHGILDNTFASSFTQTSLTCVAAVLIIAEYKTTHRILVY
jgi:hypothetical protein